MNLSNKAVDVLIVGGGGAGLAAALSASQSGASVLLIEKNDKVGGTTALSVGSITATQTALQQKAGISDSSDAHFEDMGIIAGENAKLDNLELRRFLVDNVPETIAWLTRIGITFTGPIPEPPHRVPRLHLALPSSKTYIYYLSRACKRAGVEIWTSTALRNLTSENGRVTGAEVMRQGRVETISARRGVVLATGDYSNGADLKLEFMPHLVDVDPINPASTGDGHRAARKLGAVIKNGALAAGPKLRFKPPESAGLLSRIPPNRWFAKPISIALERVPAWMLRPFVMPFLATYLAPEPKLYEYGAILINRHGKRFTDEVSRAGVDLPAQPDKVGYIVFDDTVAKAFSKWPNFVSTAPGIAYAYVRDYARLRPDVYKKANSIAELAVAIGVDEKNLESSLNAAKENRVQPSCNENDQQHDVSKNSAASQPPYHALGPVYSWLVTTQGGLHVNTRMQVLREDGTELPGLYAAGTAGLGGMLVGGHGHYLGWAFTSGRFAGTNAAHGDFK